MLVRKCDICGGEIRSADTRYKLVFESIFFKKEKDVCKECLQRIASEVRKDNSPQTDLLVKTPQKSRESHEKNCETCRDKDAYDEWQGNCDECENGSMYTPQTDRMTEEEIDTMLAKALVGQTDCSWMRYEE